MVIQMMPDLEVEKLFVYPKFTERNGPHISLVHFLYPVICVLKVGRLLNLKDKKSDKYASAITDYWIRSIVSFADFYRYNALF